jgi:trypsin-like peptidase
MPARNLETSVSAFSRTALQLEARFESTPAANATGFLYLVGEQFYLITNWHVVTGRHAETGKHLSAATAIEPDRLCTSVLASWGPLLRFVPVELPLFEDADRFHPRWLVHPTLGRSVDAVALPFDASLVGEMLAANRIASNRIALAEGDDVFVLGFPKGLTGGWQFPIWKRGSIASVPSLDWCNLPAILIDTATREGMSGAPVIARSNHMLLPGMDFALEGTSEMSMFIGLYSGRLGASEMEALRGEACHRCRA